jgi:hypothetical protein
MTSLQPLRLAHKTEAQSAASRRRLCTGCRHFAAAADITVVNYVHEVAPCAWRLAVLRYCPQCIRIWNRLELAVCLRAFRARPALRVIPGGRR